MLLAALALVGCEKNDVKVYHVENAETNMVAVEPAPAMPAMPATMPAGLPAPDHSALPPLKYTVPAGWTEKAPTQMRVASFEISENGKTADVSVVPLGGMAGGDLANVNRWRGQVGLPPATDEDSEKLAEKIEVAGQPGELFDLAGTSQRIVGAILHQGDTAWFFKMTGDPDLVEKQKPAFVSFLKTLQFSDAH
jgi:hypothetical protein